MFIFLNFVFAALNKSEISKLCKLLVVQSEIIGCDSHCFVLLMSLFEIYLLFAYIILSSVKVHVAECQPYRKELFAWFVAYAHYISS